MYGACSFPCCDDRGRDLLLIWGAVCSDRVAHVKVINTARSSAEEVDRAAPLEVDNLSSQC